MHGDPLLLNITTEILPNQKPVRKSYRALPGVMMGTVVGMRVKMRIAALTLAMAQRGERDEEKENRK
jgi:hypothetical protein